MPTYEYHCDKCGDEFEKDQRITEPAGAECPSCGSSKTHRLISHTSFVLKGSGWYVTDYGRKGRSDDSSKHKSKGNGSSDSRKKSETRTASKQTAPSTEKSSTAHAH